MQVDQLFYVYEHHRPDTGECFYVGKGKGMRAWSMRRRGQHRSITDKLARLGLNVDVRIIADRLCEQDAFAVERALIAKHGRRDRGMGTLINATDGGDGRAGWKASEGTREKISRALKGNRNFAGHTCSDEHKRKLSEKFKGRAIPAEQRQKISDTKRGCRGTFTGKKHTAAAKEMIRARRVGAKHSQETKAKIRAALLAHFAGGRA